jgi:hypothetical protein
MNDLVSVLLALAAVLFGWIVSRYYYGRTLHDLGELQKSLESLGTTTYRLISAQNPEQTGEIIKSRGGKWAVKWARTLSEANIRVSADVAAKVIPSDKGGQTNSG